MTTVCQEGRAGSMSSKERLPRLTGWEATRDTLHAYLKVIAAVPRALAAPQPHYWHLSLKLDNGLLWTDPIHYPSIGSKALRLNLDLERDAINIMLGGELVTTLMLAAEPTASALADSISTELDGLGIEFELDPERVDNEQPRSYDPDFASRYLAALEAVHDAQEQAKSRMKGETGPIQLWPHHFDQSFEWFSPRKITVEREGEQEEAQPQINFGFAPGDETFPDPYFYSNPWPFDPTVESRPLASGARWTEDGFQGSMLPYQDLTDNPDPVAALVSYYISVYQAAEPMLGS
jgi:hypothetical protein